MLIYFNIVIDVKFRGDGNVSSRVVRHSEVADNVVAVVVVDVVLC